MPILGPFTVSQIRHASAKGLRRHNRMVAQLKGFIDQFRTYPYTARNIGGPFMEKAVDTARREGRFMFPPVKQYTRMPPQGTHVRAADLLATNKVFQKVPGEATAPSHFLRHIVYERIKGAPQQTWGMNQQRMRAIAHKMFNPRTQSFVPAVLPTDKFLMRPGLRPRLARYVREQEPLGPMRPRRPR